MFESPKTQVDEGFEGSAYFMYFRRWAALTQKGREGKRIGMGVAACPKMELGVSVDGILVSRAELVWFYPPPGGRGSTNNQFSQMPLV